MNTARPFVCLHCDLSKLDVVLSGPKRSESDFWALGLGGCCSSIPLNTLCKGVGLKSGELRNSALPLGVLVSYGSRRALGCNLVLDPAHGRSLNTRR